jgi:hypothetical protein
VTKTFSFVVDTVAGGEALIVPVACRRVTVREDGAVATAGYKLMAPSNADVAYVKLAGEATTFEAYPPGTLIHAGQLLGYFQAISGSMTFTGICEGW